MATRPMDPETVAMQSTSSSSSKQSVSDLLGRICFSNALINPPFRRIKQVFFHRIVLWPGAVMLALGLITIQLVGANERLLVLALLLSMPFVLWLALLLLVSSIASVLLLPRLLILGLAGAAFYLGLHGVVTRIARWAAKYDQRPGALPLGSASGRPSDSPDAR